MKTEERIEKIRGHLNMAYCMCEGDLSLLTEALAKGMAEQGRSSEYVRKGIFAAFAIAIKKTIDRSNNRRQQLERIWGEKCKPGESLHVNQENEHCKLVNQEKIESLH